MGTNTLHHPQRCKTLSFRGAFICSDISKRRLELMTVVRSCSKGADCAYWNDGLTEEVLYQFVRDREDDYFDFIFCSY